MKPKEEQTSAESCAPCAIGNGLRQDANTSDLIFDSDVIIEHLSTAFTLEPGDVNVTGTPSGAALFMNSKCWLRDGDVVRIEITGLGAIENRVADEARAQVEVKSSTFLVTQSFEAAAPVRRRCPPCGPARRSGRRSRRQ